MKVSASFLKTYMTCPLQAKFKYVDKIPVDFNNAKAVFGTVIHHSLEHYNHHGDVDKAVDMFKGNWTDPENLGIDSTKLTWPKFTTFGSLMERGIEVLRSYHDKNKWENRTVLATEHHFTVPFGDHHLNGFVDLVEIKKTKRGKPSLRIVDYKTNGRAPNMTELALNIQFTVYLYASLQPEFWLGNPDFNIPAMPNGEQLYEQLQDMPRRAIWYGLMQSKEYDAGPRDDRDYMRLYRLVNQIEQAANLQVYVPIIGGDSCIFCDFTEDCTMDIPQRVAIAEKNDDD